MSRGFLTEICVFLLGSSCSTVSLPAGREGVFRPWDDCAQLGEIEQDVYVAGVVRTIEGRPIPGAQIRLADGSLGVAAFGHWRPWLDDDVDSNAAKSRVDGSFRIMKDRYEAVRGVAVVQAFSRGYRVASASWVGAAPVCVEFVLSEDPAKPKSMRE
jgi:hypothetical protein